MAIEQVMNEDGAGQEAPRAQRGRSGLGKVLLMTAGAFLLVGMSVGATLFLTGLLGQPATESVTANDAREQRPPIYVELGEPMVVNFLEGAHIRYLQVRIEAMTRDPEVAASIARHLPQIRNALVFMFGGYEYASLGTVDGKQKVREDALAQVREVVRRESGSAGVEAVYFTSFVMQ